MTELASQQERESDIEKIKSQTSPAVELTEQAQDNDKYKAGDNSSGSGNIEEYFDRRLRGGVVNDKRLRGGVANDKRLMRGMPNDEGILGDTKMMGEDGMLGDDVILRYDEHVAQPCTGAENCVMISDCEDDDNYQAGDKTPGSEDIEEYCEVGDAKMMGGDGRLG